MKNKLMMVLTAAAFVLQSAFANTAPRPDITGKVLTDGDSPLANATVFVSTAGPKIGASLICPSCYPDCAKKAKTDAQGKFTIKSVDPELTFQLLVVAAGHKPKYVSKTDPAKGAVTVNLKHLTAEELNNPTRILGIVIAPDGSPVAGATLDVEGATRGGSTSWGAVSEYGDPVAVSDDKGMFAFSCKGNTSELHATVTAPNVATRWVTLKAGQDQVVRMDEGAVVSGRVVRDGKPVADAKLGLITTQRQCGECLHDFRATTDADGRFMFGHVPPNNDYHLFITIDSLVGKGSFTSKTISVGATGSTLAVGDLALKPGRHVMGRLVLSDGKAVPPGVRVLLSRDDAWDNTEASVAPDGSFEFKDLPNGSVSLSARVKGYKFSKTNPSLDWLNGGIVGRIEEDIPNLDLLMEPGKWQFNREDDRPSGVDAQPRNKPLRSAPTTSS